MLGGHLLRAVHHFERIDPDRVATRAWVSEIAHPAANDTIKAAVLTANNVLAI